MAAIAVSMYQNGTGQCASSRSVQPLSGRAYRSRYTSLPAIGNTTRGACRTVSSAACPATGQNRARSAPVSTRNA